ncbi:serine/threonine-protein kinase HAL4/sat4, partial [Lunasporangiospora selenospora]
MVHRDGVDILMADHSDDQKCSGKLQTNRRQHSPASVRIDTSLSILSPHSVMPVPPKSSISLSPACDLRHHPHCYHHQIEGQLQEQHPQQPIYSLQDSLHPAHRSSSCEQSAPSITRSSLVVTPVADQEGFDGNKDATHPSNVGGDVEEVLSAERDAIAVSVARRLGGNNSGGPQCLIQQRDHLQCSTASCPASHSCRYSRPGVRDGGNKIGLEDSDGLGVTDSEILVRQLVVMESPLSPLTVMLPAPAPSRTTTHLSSASINTPTRLTHRLSYLTQLDAEETEDNEMVEAPGLEDISNKKELSSSSFPEFDPTDQKTSSTKQPSSAPAPQPSTNSGSLWISPQPALDNSQASSQPQHKQAGPNEEDVPVEDNKPCSGRSNKSYGSLSSRGSNSSPAFPSLYKRLLRIFKPPSDTLDEDNLNIQQDFPQTCQPSSNVVLPKVTPQKPPHTLGFRAKFMRRLKSSPMISSQAVNPITGDTTQHPMDQSVGCEVNEPLLSDYEHEQSCPAGQRIQRRRNRGSRRRAATMPRLPPPSPTLQSKYGVPSKELGAGTQAQVMLLRVRSANRTRLSHPLTSRAVDAGKAHPIGTASNCLSPTSPGLPPSPARRSLSPEDAVETFLRPRSRSGTLMTTTDDAVTPEQREAYRKRLLRRSSTGALSISENGVDEPSVALKTHHSSAKLKSQSQSKNSYGSSEGNEYCSTFEDDNTGEDDFEFKDDGRDCSCLRQSSRYLRGVKSAGDIRPVAYSHGRPIESYSSSTKKRTAARKPIAAKQGRRRSTDMAPAYRKHSESSPLGSALVDYDHSRGSSPILPATDTTSRNSTVAAEVRRKLQQQEHELRQRELARLKELQYEHQQQQKMRERQQQQQQQQKQQQQQQQQSRLLSLFRNENVFPEYCMVMEFAAGGDLFNLLTKAYPPISLQEKHCLWRQLLNGVQFMHSTGVAHRDLKPENLLLDATGRILKITDFGIANVFRSVGDPAPLPCRGIIGSEPYIAPEEFYQAEYDPRAVDVWACGIIFYVMYYSAMPWARADRKKDARFARFWNDITSHRMSEAARRLHYERRQLYFGQQSRDSGSSG